MTSEQTSATGWQKPLVGVNLKLHLGYSETLRYLESIAALVDQGKDVDVFVLPSFPMLAEACRTLDGSGIAAGAQDVHWEDRGAFTGCVSPAMLRSIGCRYAAVGHAERRDYFHENDGMAGRKAAAAIQNGLVPIICIGEEYPDQDAVGRVLGQLSTVFEELPNDGAEVILAYEPIWAIGASAPADTTRVSTVTSAIRSWGEPWEGPIRLVYGGSVVAESVAALLSVGIDGVFASRGALDPRQLRRFVDTVTLPRRDRKAS